METAEAPAILLKAFLLLNLLINSRMNAFKCRGDSASCLHGAREESDSNLLFTVVEAHLLLLIDPKYDLDTKTYPDALLCAAYSSCLYTVMGFWYQVLPFPAANRRLS